MKFKYRMSFLLLIGIFFALASFNTENPTPEKPNILFIISDKKENTRKKNGGIN